MRPEAEAIVDHLSLSPHPEGGFFRETFRSSERLPAIRAGGARTW